MSIIQRLSNKKRVIFHWYSNMVSTKLSLIFGYGISRFKSNFIGRSENVEHIATNIKHTIPIFQTLTSMTAGIATVSMITSCFEYITSFKVPTFSPSGTRFDLSTYMGRFCNMLLNCDPSLLLYNHDDVIRNRKMLKDYRSVISNLAPGKSIKDVSRDLWNAERIVASCGDENKLNSIPPPFRISGYVPFNGPICVAMIVSTSTPYLLFWSWVNQSQNALVNYYNRAQGSEMTTEKLIKSYVISVVSGLSVAFGLATWIKRRCNYSKARQLMRYIAFPSAVIASSLNCFIIRSPEIEQGIPLLDEKGNDVLPGSRSHIAARKGVYATTASRAILQAPVFILPPLMFTCVPTIKNIISKNPKMSVPLMTYLVMLAFGLGFPATVAIFPHISEIKVEEVEICYKQLKKENHPYKKFFYNKGF